MKKLIFTMAVAACFAAAQAQTNEKLPLGFQLSSDLSMLHRSGYESSAMNATSSIWNAQLTKTLLRDRLTLSLIAHDILDRTNNHVWSISSTGYSNTSYNTLPRYVMLSAAYRFNKQPKKK